MEVGVFLQKNVLRNFWKGLLTGFLCSTVDSGYQAHAPITLSVKKYVLNKMYALYNMYTLNIQVCNQVPRQWCSSPVTFIYIVTIKLCNICNQPAKINHVSTNYTVIFLLISSAVIVAFNFCKLHKIAH